MEALSSDEMDILEQWRLQHKKQYRDLRDSHTEF